MRARAFESVDVGAQTTIFYREAPGGSEGFVIDNQLLVQTLRERVLEEQGLASALDLQTASSLSAGRLGLESGGASAHYHRFSEPLASIEAWLRLAPLEMPETERLLMPLAFILGLLIVLGLFLLYRTVAVQLQFAERQNNFVSAVTHELKTPLTAIRMHGEMLKDGLVESPEKAQEYYGTITAQAERLSRLIGNVLWLSNIERNPGAEAQEGDLREPVLQTVRALTPHIERSGFSLVVDVPQKVPPVVRDPDSVEQILFNLVENAIKYARDAEDRRITIGVEVTERSVELSVRDRGPGAPSGQLKRIFEPFFRGERELTRKSAGTGLGLALVDHLARRMSASVSAKNAESGIVVTVSFPLHSKVQSTVT